MGINKSALLKGTVGDRVYRVVEGTQIVSMLPASVKQPRTREQMEHRCKWPNVSAMYRALRPYVKRCFEDKEERVNDYNRFMSLNLARPAVYITKMVANLRGGVVAPYMVSYGSLDSIEVTGTGNSAKTNISLGTLVIDENTTVGQFAEAVVTNNSGFAYNDQIAFMDFVQKQDATVDIPIIRGYGWRVNLTQQDTTKLAAVGGNIGFASKDGYLGVSSTELGDCAFCWVHSRKTSGNKTLVSPQRLVSCNTLLANYTSDAAKQASMESYGVSEDVFITPNGTSSGSGSVTNSSSTTTSDDTASSGGTDEGDPFDPYGT